MLCFIYKSLKTEYLYVYIDKKDDFSALPEALLNSLGQLEWVMSLELSSERKLAQENVEKVMERLINQGFYIQLPPAKKTLALPLST